MKATLTLTAEFVKAHADHIPYSVMVVYAAIVSNQKTTLKALAETWGIPYPTVRYASVVLHNAGLIKSNGGSFDDAGFTVYTRSKVRAITSNKTDIEREIFMAVVSEVQHVAQYAQAQYVFTKFTSTLIRKLIGQGIDSVESAVKYIKWFLKVKSNKRFTWVFLANEELVNEYRKTNKAKTSTANKFEKMHSKYNKGVK